MESLATDNAEKDSSPNVGALAGYTPAEHIEQFFEYKHLPERLQIVSKQFAALARNVISLCPRNPERTVALRKLLEAKDAAVRAVVAR